METPPQSVRILTASERERVLRAASTTEITSVVFTAMHTGLKRGEILALKRDAINLEQGTLTVTHTLSNTKGKVARLPALLGSQRTISLDNKVIQHLEPYLDINDDAFLFRRSTGEQILPNYATHVFKKLVRNIHLYDVKFQDLRHAYVAMQIEAGKPYHSILKHIGLRDSRSMTDVYGHLFEEETRE
jgi:integrase